LFDDYVEYAALASRHLWHASGGISTSHRVVHVNRNSPVVLRAPMEAQGHTIGCKLDKLILPIRDLISVNIKLPR
jgi:hypothetical protein